MPWWVRLSVAACCVLGAVMAAGLAALLVYYVWVALRTRTVVQGDEALRDRVEVLEEENELLLDANAELRRENNTLAAKQEAEHG